MKSAKDQVKENIKNHFKDVDIKKLDLDFELVTMDYADLEVTHERPNAIQTTEFRNDTDGTDQQVFSVDRATTDTFTWTITEGLELGTTFKVGVPFFVNEQASIKINFSSTQGQSTSVQRRWSTSNTVVVPPRSVVTASFIVYEGRLDTPFTAKFKADGKIELKLKHDKKIEGKISELIQEGKLPKELFEVQSKGMLSADTAARFDVRTRQVNLGGSLAKAAMVATLASGSAMGRAEVRV
jgi:hypothetical protein